MSIAPQNRVGRRVLLILLTAGLAVLAANAVAGFVVHYIGPLTPAVAVLMDTVILGLVVFLGFWLLAYRPMSQRLKEYMRTEQALRESEARLKATLESAADGILVVNERGAVTHANNRFAAMWRIPPELMASQDDKRMLDFVLDQLENPEAFLSRVQQLYVSSEEDFDILRFKDGRIFERFSCPLLCDGNIAGRVWSFRDMTARERSEEALIREHVLVSRVMETSPEGIVMVNRDGKITLANPQAEQVLGLTRSDLAHRSYNDPAWRITDYDGQPFPDEMLPFQIVKRTGKPVMDARHAIEWPNGRRVFLSINAAPLLDEAGRFDGMVASVEDVTRRKAAEEALRDSEERYRSFVQNFQGIAFRGRTDFTPVFLHGAVEAITGYTEEEFLADKIRWDQLIHPEDRPAMTANTEGLHSIPGFSIEFEYRIVRKDQQVRWIHMIARNGCDDSGKVAFVQGAIYDISERKRGEEEREKLETQVQQSQKLESLGVLAGGIAHDFNNLLMGILGNADLALDELPAASPARDSLRQIEMASKRAADLCRQMLAYSGRGKFVIEPVNLNDIVEEMGRLLEVSISKKTVLRCNFARDLPAIEADATQIRQVVMNLITNASEAIGEKSGVIRLTTGVMECNRAYLSEAWLDEQLPEGRYVYLEVSDTGCGMDEATRRRIFDPFFTTKFAGRGLGLAAVLGIVRGHKGAIKVYSEPGRGTTFKILFPGAGGLASIAAEWQHEAAEWRGSGTVLLVDDEATIRSVAGRMLERLGFAVLTAANGQEALDLFREQADRITCVLLDLTMPHMDGEETFRELRRIREDVRVILSSGYNEQDVTQRFAGKGLAGFIQKPYQVATLVAKLREALRNRRR